MIDLVRKVKELLEPEGAWIKWHLARDKDDNLVKGTSPEACKFCLAGAMFRVTGYDEGMYREMVQFFGSIHPSISGYGVSYFNDELCDSQSDMLDFLSQAITKLEEEND